MVGALKHASERAGAAKAGGAGAASTAACFAASSLAGIGRPLRRGEFFAGLFILGFSNGIFGYAVAALMANSAWGAISSGFGISVLVWAAAWIASALLLRLPSEPPTRSDVVAGAAFAGAMLVPLPQASWIALTGLGLYVLRGSEAGSPARRAAFVVVAVTVPMFWSRAIFVLLSDLILQADAILVGWIVGTERVGNTIRFSDDWGYLFLAPGCSSLANVSLAVLAWVLFTQALARRVTLTDVGWCLAACAAVVLINVTRLGLMGLYREHFELLHGPVGAGVAGFLTFAAIVGINMVGARRELVSRV